MVSSTIFVVELPHNIPGINQGLGQISDMIRKLVSCIVETFTEYLADPDCGEYPLLAMRLVKGFWCRSRRRCFRVQKAEREWTRQYIQKRESFILDYSSSSRKWKWQGNGTTCMHSGRRNYGTLLSSIGKKSADESYQT